MVIVEPETEGPQNISKMCWFFTEDEVEEIDGKFYVEVEFSKHKWLPTSPQEAYRWFVESPNAAGVRAKGRNVRIHTLMNTLGKTLPEERTGKRNQRTILLQKSTMCQTNSKSSQTTTEWSLTASLRHALQSESTLTTRCSRSSRKLARLPPA